MKPTSGILFQHNSTNVIVAPIETVTHGESLGPVSTAHQLRAVNLDWIGRGGNQGTTILLPGAARR